MVFLQTLFMPPEGWRTEEKYEKSITFKDVKDFYIFPDFYTFSRLIAF